MLLYSRRYCIVFNVQTKLCERDLNKLLHTDYPRDLHTNNSDDEIFKYIALSDGSSTRRLICSYAISVNSMFANWPRSTGHDRRLLDFTLQTLILWWPQDTNLNNKKRITVLIYYPKFNLFRILSLTKTQDQSKQENYFIFQLFQFSLRWFLWLTTPVN